MYVVSRAARIGWAALAALSLPLESHALDKPTGAPLVLSSIETEQGVPLAVLSPDGKIASCVTVRLHWAPVQGGGADTDSTSFTLDLAQDSPGASIFMAELWHASLASALAWQQPWENAAWKVFDTPTTNGTGIDAGLAVGMIATAARRPYPKDTIVIGSLKPDGTLGAVPRLDARLDAAAAAGITRVVIPSVQRFDVDASGQVLNLVRHAEDLHLQCIPVDNLVDATEQVMHDPLPEVTLSGTTPKYGNDVSSYIDDFARREQNEMNSGLAYAPKEADLGTYPAPVAAIWKSIYADNEAAQQAYRAGQVYMAFRLFAQANGRMHGVNALSGESDISFDVKSALGNADDLRARLHDLMNPPSIDQGDLESALVVAEMADWAYDISAALEGAQLVTKQAFSQRTDATPAEKDRAREAILFANAECRYLLDGADFYTGLLAHVDEHKLSVDANAEHLLPQLIPAQLATAQIFTDGIRSRANALRDGLLFDPRLVAYIDVLKKTKSAWEARSQKKEIESTAPNPGTPTTSVKLDSTATGAVGFDPGTTYAPPHVTVAASAGKKLSDAAACLIWANSDCEIAALDEKYLHLDGDIDPSTHEWRIKDRAKLDELLQAAEGGARLGLTMAEKAEIDTSVLDMIFERASQLRLQNNDTSGLDALRNYWRCALLGNMCWQLAHTHKAEPVDLAGANGKDKAKPDPSSDKKTETDKPDAATAKNDDATKKSDDTDSHPADEKPATVAKTVDDHAGAPAEVKPVPVAKTDDQPAPAPKPVPVAPIVPAVETNTPPRALPVTDNESAPAPNSQDGPVKMPPPQSVTPPAPAPTGQPQPAPTATDDSNIPVAPIARAQDISGNLTNAPPAHPVASPANDNSNGDQF
jgi:hypothetical protein